MMEDPRPTRVKKSKLETLSTMESVLPNKGKKRKATHSHVISSISKQHIVEPKVKSTITANNLVLVQTKRPRGRPPLNKPVGFPPQMLIPCSNSTKVAPTGKVGVSKAKFSSSNPKQSGPSTVLSGLSNSAGVGGDELVKTIRPPVAAATRTILSRVMTSDPVTIPDLATSLSDVPKDLVQSVMEVLQVMGLVAQVKAKEGSTQPGGHAVFSFAELSKLLIAVDIVKMENEVGRCINMKADVDRRNERLQVWIDNLLLLSTSKMLQNIFVVLSN